MVLVCSFCFGLMDAAIKRRIKSVRRKAMKTLRMCGFTIDEIATAFEVEAPSVSQMTK